MSFGQHFHQLLFSFDGLSQIRSQFDSFADHQAQGHAEPERLTPLKYTSNHSASSFSAGILVCVKQKYLPNNDVINNVNVIKISESMQHLILSEKM